MSPSASHRRRQVVAALALAVLSLLALLAPVVTAGRELSLEHEQRQAQMADLSDLSWEHEQMQRDLADLSDAAEFLQMEEQLSESAAATPAVQSRRARKVKPIAKAKSAAPAPAAPSAKDVAAAEAAKAATAALALRAKKEAEALIAADPCKLGDRLAAELRSYAGSKTTASYLASSAEVAKLKTKCEAQKAAAIARSKWQKSMKRSAATAAPKCGPIALNPNATASRVADSYPVGESVVIKCDRGFQLLRASRLSASPADFTASTARSAISRNFTITCASGGEGVQPTWTTPAQMLQCVPARCPTIHLQDPNLAVSGNKGTHGTQRTYSCPAPYTMDGVASVVCDAGKWSPSGQPTCFINECDSFAAPKNGDVAVASNATSPVKRLQYSCETGYKMAGSPTAYCQPNHQWSSPAPRCRPFGLKAYVGRAPTFSAGSLSIDNAFLLEGLLEAGRRTPDCIGVTIKRSKGVIKVRFLHADNSFLEPRVTSDTYLFGKGGKAELHHGFASTKRALLGELSFASNAHFLTGVMHAVQTLQATQPEIIGFSVSAGSSFHVELLSWAGLPLHRDVSANTFVLSSVEQQVQEVGCYSAFASGAGALKTKHELANLEVGQKASRLSCAAAARLAGHRTFALSNGECFSGNEDVTTQANSKQCGGRFSTPGASTKPGAAEGVFHTFALDSSLLAKGPYASRCRVLHQTMLGGSELTSVRQAFAAKSSSKCQSACSNNVACSVAVFTRKTKACQLFSGSARKASSTASAATTSFDCSLPALVNGGFESPATGKFFPVPLNGKSLRLPENGLRGWASSGAVGIALRGSNYSNVEETIPEGRALLWMEDGAEISQELRGLRRGRTYRLSFSESFRTPSVDSPDYVSGMSIQVYAGRKVVYSNMNIHLPLWAKREATFVATSSRMTITVTTSGKGQRRAAKQGGKDASAVKGAVLLDAMVVSRPTLRPRRSRSPAVGGRGTLLEVSVKDAAIVAALGAVARRLPNVAGFSLKNGEARLLSQSDLTERGVLADSFSSLYLNNGSVVHGFRTAVSAGFLSFNAAPEVHRALKTIASEKANSIGYTLSTGSHWRASIISASALPLTADATTDSYLFADAQKEMGCWSVKSAGQQLFETKHTLVGGVNKHACSLKAAKAGHRFFALQNKQCFSGNTEFTTVGNGLSADCSVRCHNGRDNCGGSLAGMVYKLPSFSRVSTAGVVDVSPAATDADQTDRASFVFDEPGRVDYSSLASAKPSADEAKALAAAPVLKDGTRSTFSHSLVYHFPASQAHMASLYTVQAPSAKSMLPLAPRSWVLEGSVDGRTWKLLDEVVGQTWSRTGQVRKFAMHNRVAYHFMRLVVTQNQLARDTPLPPNASAGFMLSGVSFFVSSDDLVQLVGLYRFEDETVVGLDSSERFNDLVVVGDRARATVGSEESLRFMGQGYLDLTGSKNVGEQAFLAVDAAALGAPRGLPKDDESFSVAFWFRINSTNTLVGVKGASPFGVMAWGSAKGSASANSFQLSSSVQNLVQTFGKPGSGSGLISPAPFDGKALVDRWVHYALTFDGASGEELVYLDGSEIGSRIYANPSLKVAARKFRLGLTKRGPQGDAFRGLLDDVALFRGALSPAQVREAQSGNFLAFEPLNCQQMSDRFGIASAESWGNAPTRTRKEYMRLRCDTVPSSCQALSDVYGITPRNGDKKDFYVAQLYKSSRCATYPSFQIRAGATASCPSNAQQVIRTNVLNGEEARRICLAQMEPKCQSYVWTPQARVENTPSRGAVAVPANTLSMCSAHLHGWTSGVSGAETAHRLRTYLITADSSNRCDEKEGRVVANVTSSLQARALCDRARNPPCSGFIWSGPIGIGSDPKASPTPNMAMLCTGYMKHAPTLLPGSKYVSGAAVGDYMVYASRYGACSAASEIITKFDIQSSLQARLLCDEYDGVTKPKCLSYVWNVAQGELKLCGGVPQGAGGAMELVDSVESGWIRPTTCQQISNRWGVALGKSWGVANTDVKRMYIAMGCQTSPTPCQALSDFYALSPSSDLSAPSKIPGSIKDLWGASGCKTSPVAQALDRQKPAYQSVSTNVDAIETKVAAVDDVLSRAALAKSPERQAAVQAELTQARRELEDAIKDLE